MPRLIIFSLILCSCFCAVSSAKELVFTHSNHPLVNNVLKPMLEEVYAELGYTLVFQEAEGARALKLLNDGLVDGDVGRLEPITRSLKNALSVAQLDTINVVLYCRLDIYCDQSVLQDTMSRILVPTQDATLKLLTREIVAKLYFNNDWQSILTMFDAGKVDYLLWIESHLIAPLTLKNINKTATPIGPFALSHLLHVKHKALAEAVSDKINKRLITLNQPLANQL